MNGSQLLDTLYCPQFKDYQNGATTLWLGKHRQTSST
jgi:hypothetical protein